MQKKTVKNPNDGSRAYDYAVYLLGLHLRTTGELKQKLQEKGYADGIISSTLDQLTSQRYLDDQRFAEVFLDNLKKYKNFGFYGIKKKLMEKRLPSELIESVLAEGLSVEDEIKIAKRLLKKVGAAIESLDADAEEANGPRYNTFNEVQSRQKQKIAQKLKARGFRTEALSRFMV